MTGSFAAALSVGRLERTAAASETDESAIVYAAKKIITMERDQPIATAVAVRGARIIAVGSLDSVTETLSGKTYTIDDRFADKTMMPGFVEQHLHPLLGVMTMSTEIIAIEDWAVPGKFSKAATTPEEYRSRLTETIAQSAPSSETLYTWGFHQYFHGKLYRPELDAISPDRPVVIWHRSCHELIFNSAALKKLGITEAALAGKGVASDQASWENGHFYEKGLTLAIPFILSDFVTPDRVAEGTRILKAYLHQNGITTICEPGTQMNRKVQQYWETALNGDDVTFRTYFIPDGRALYDQYKGDTAKMLEVTPTFTAWGSGNVQWLPQHVKLFSDGAIFSLLMQVEEPYLDGHKGEWIALPEEYQQAFRAYWDAGYQIHTHVNGDAGLQVVVDALAERVAAHPRSDHRFTVVHFAVATDGQVKQLAKLGANVSGNPYYVTSLADKYAETGLGPARADSMVRLGSVVDEGISISLHSDMPMAPAQPLLLAWAAANRVTVSGRTAAPDQRITLEMALRAITIEAAYSLRLEDEIGSIKPGKKADFTILDSDPFAVSPAEVKDIRVWGSILEGRISPVMLGTNSASVIALPPGLGAGPDGLDHPIG